jgi:hypothetical protein
MNEQKDGLHDTGFEQAGGPDREPRITGGPGGRDEDGTGATSMTDGERSQASSGIFGGSNPARPGGLSDGPTGADTQAPGMESATPGPIGPGGGAEGAGTGGQGSLGSGTYNERGDLTGPDSPAGPGTGQVPEGAGQGDDLANRLGGGSGRGTGLTGAGAATGDMGADRSEATGSATINPPSAGDPGGMGGVHAKGGSGTGRPPGGSSPLGTSSDN